MTEVISVKFKSKGKVYYFDPNGITAAEGDHLIVETAKGLEYAECVSGNHNVDDSAVRPPLRPVIRIATDDDNRRAEENRRREQEAFDVCKQKIEKHGLDMKLVDVEYNFEGNKILFFFTSDGRVDFRELVKDLAAIFKTRIELRQIGVRDEARMLGGLGICGKPFCCSEFLDDFQPVSIKMAKTQGLSLNPTKISGTCGRLMCCLKYEQDAYEDLVKNVPKVDSFVETPSGKGSVVDVNLLKSSVRVRLEDQNDLTIKTFPASEVQVLGGKAKRAEYLALKAEGKIPESKPTPRLKKVSESTPKEADTTSAPAPTPEKLESVDHTEPPKRQRRRKSQRPAAEQKHKVEQKPTQDRPKTQPHQSDSVQPTEAKTETAAKRPNRRRRYHHNNKSGGNKPQTGE